MSDGLRPFLPEHYERHLGLINRGWSDENCAHGVQVVQFGDQPEHGVDTYATLGLGEHIVELSTSKTIRQELLISANRSTAADSVAGLLLNLAEHVLRRGAALFRGEVIEPHAPVVPGSNLKAIYVTNPSPFDESLTKFDSPSPPTVFAYLIPITESEALLTRQNGWRWFEDQLEHQNPDIWDFARTHSIHS